jgi:hypothetical protein
LENTLASKTAEHSITMKKNISAFLLGWSKAMEQSSRLQNPSPSTFSLTKNFCAGLSTEKEDQPCDHKSAPTRQQKVFFCHKRPSLRLMAK